MAETPVRVLANLFATTLTSPLPLASGETLPAGTQVVFVPQTTTNAVLHGEKSLAAYLPDLEDTLSGCQEGLTQLKTWAGGQWHGTISITNEEGAYQFTFAEHGLPDCGQYAVQLTSDAPYRMAVLNRSSSGFLVQIYDDAGEARNPLWDTVVTCNLGVFCGEGIYCGQVTPLTVDIHAYLDFAEH